MLIRTSVTTLGKLLHFGQVFNNYFAQIAHIYVIFVEVSKSFTFLVEWFFVNFLLVTLIRTPTCFWHSEQASYPASLAKSECAL